MKIMTMLHMSDSSNVDENDRLFKLRHVIDTCVSKFGTVYVPNEHISVDESLLKFHGRLKFKQYNPSKRGRFGIKFYKLCESSGLATGYVYNMKVYTGQDNQGENIAASTKVVIQLAESLLNKGYSIYTDNWYSSPDLFSRLNTSKTNACGTVKFTRKNMPKLSKKQKMKKGEVFAKSGPHNMLALMWMDKKEVKMLSTIHTSKMVNTGKSDNQGNSICKPACVLDYNKYMDGVDRSDQMAATCRSVRKYIKWYKKLFFIFLTCVL
jgi:hypothetical protein